MHKTVDHHESWLSPKAANSFEPSMMSQTVYRSPSYILSPLLSSATSGSMESQFGPRDSKSRARSSQMCHSDSGRGVCSWAFANWERNIRRVTTVFDPGDEGWTLVSEWRRNGKGVVVGQLERRGGIIDMSGFSQVGSGSWAPKNG